MKHAEQVVSEVGHEEQLDGQDVQYNELEDFLYPVWQDVIAVGLEHILAPDGQLIHVEVVLSR